MTMMQWLRPKQNLNKVRFIAMMESGVLVDEVADITQTQVIAQKAKASIRNRDAVPIYYQLEEDAPPVWKENAIVETGLAEPPGTSSRHVLEDAQNLWMGYQTGTVDSGGWNLETKHLGLIALGVSMVLFIIMAWLTSLNLAEPVQVVEKDGKNSTQQSTGQSPGTVENSHGPVPSGETPQETDGGAAVPRGAAGESAVPVRAGPDGTVPADSVAPRNDGDSPQP